ncbi:MAG: hypothetical protein RIS43_117 [Actinomycetota bacterium]|jgi:8-oxo-dGTP diphosphatase
MPAHRQDLVAAAIIYRRMPKGCEILSARRTEPEALRGGWELPGGRVEDDKDVDSAAAAIREVEEELGCDVSIVEMLPGPLSDGSWPLAHNKRIHVFICTIEKGEPYIREQHDAIAWIQLDAAATAVPWLQDDIPIVEAAVNRIRILESSRNP